MSYRSIALVKQVPDTANISGQVMKPDGTVNRAMLPAVFNPEDKVAMELALQTKDKYGGEVIAGIEFIHNAQAFIILPVKGTLSNQISKLYKPNYRIKTLIIVNIRYFLGPTFINKVPLYLKLTVEGVMYRT